MKSYKEVYQGLNKQASMKKTAGPITSAIKKGFKINPQLPVLRKLVTSARTNPFGMDWNQLMRDWRPKIQGSLTNLVNNAGLTGDEGTKAIQLIKRFAANKVPSYFVEDGLVHPKGLKYLLPTITRKVRRRLDQAAYNSRLEKVLEHRDLLRDLSRQLQKVRDSWNSFRLH